MMAWSPQATKQNPAYEPVAFFKCGNWDPRAAPAVVRTPFIGSAAELNIQRSP
jgi:hypothetical protein